MLSYVVVVDDYHDLAHATSEIIKQLIEDRIDSIENQSLACMRNYLSQIKVVTFTNPQEALKFINENIAQVAMIISDNDMPEITGIQLLSYIFNQKKNIDENLFMVLYSTAIDKIIEDHGANENFSKNIIPLNKPCGFLGFKKLLDGTIFQIGCEEICLV